MVKRFALLLAATSSISMASTALAQDRASANAETAAQQDNEAVDSNAGEIIVTARRKDESIQDVPLTVNAVTSETVEKLNILTFQDITKVVSGLQLTGSGGFQAAASVRGVTFQAQSGASATVATYINEAPTPANSLFQGIFDIGQFEVLKGPQGTERGISSPSGSITVTTRRPDLSEVGASFNGTLTNRDAHNLQAAVNVPIIADMLAVRVAGLVDQNAGSSVESVNSDQEPRIRSKAIRISGRFEPTDWISVNAMYQTLRRTDQTFGSALFGNGSPGLTTAQGVVTTPGYNGPVLTFDDRKAVADGRGNQTTKVKLATWQVDVRHWGQKLSYVGSWQWQFLGGPGGGDLDTGNLVPGVIIPSNLADQQQTVRTHEIRLASEERLAGFLDYTVGFFTRHEVPANFILQGLSFGPGGFGTPLAKPQLIAPNFRYGSYQQITTSNNIRETSWFGNVTAHIGDKIELTAGGRRINFKSTRSAVIALTPSFRATAGACTPAQVAAGSVNNGTYAGVCDLFVAGRPLQNFLIPQKDHSFVYNLTASYHVTPDLMVYFTHGTAWRPGPSAIGIVNGGNRPDLTALQFLDAEKSKAYEAGAKFTFLDGRGRLNLSVYQQDFDGLIYTGLGVPYLSDNGTGTSATNPTVSAFTFTLNVPARVRGFDVDLGFDINDRWNVGANFSLTNGKLKNALVPCQDSNFDGTPDAGQPTVAGFVAAGVAVAKCTSNASSTIAPKWNLNVNSEYSQPIGNDLSGFLRGNFAYQPKNPNSSLNYAAPAYGLLDLFLGIRADDRSWEVSVFGKNITNTQKILTKGSTTFNGGVNLTSFFGPTGYQTFSTTDPREFGINVRMMIGGG
jgi:iron complex outermembrane receptor protein